MDQKRITDALVDLIDYGTVSGESPPFGRVGLTQPLTDREDGPIVMRDNDGVTFTIDVRIRERGPSGGTPDAGA